jgi:ferrous iron transport protein B
MHTVLITGCPNAGKTALFNRLTGSRQKVANYPGVTVEFKEGQAHTKNGTTFRLIDIPGTYSLRAASPDEALARDAIIGNLPDIGKADMVICVADATNLKLHMRFALEIKALGIPMILALNMFDIATRLGYSINLEALSKRLGIPVVSTVAVRGGNVDDLLNATETMLTSLTKNTAPVSFTEPTLETLRAFQKESASILADSKVSYGLPPASTYAIDRVMLHPVAGIAILLAIMFLVFQAVFSWSAYPMDMIDSGMMWLAEIVGNTLPDGYLKSFITDGMIAGVGSVIIFLPQILVLFFFILLLEDSGYMARAAFLLDKLMGGVGLNGKAFIPLLSSFACAIPGIMATRTIAKREDRLTTMLVAPLMTCSARIPVYTLIIAAFIPPTSIYGFNLQGIVMFALYAIAVIFGLIIAWLLKRRMFANETSTFFMELPTYKMPALRGLAIGLLERTKIFLRRAGTIIFTVMVVLWFLATFPEAPEGAENPALHSFAAMIGTTLAPLFAPIGFNWQMVIALIPGMAAREVAVAVLGTVYAISAHGAGMEQSLAETLRAAWSLPTALAFLAWYIFAPQCISTLAVIKREAGSAKWMWFAFFYLTALAYIAAGITYHTASWLLG